MKIRTESLKTYQDSNGAELAKTPVRDLSIGGVYNAAIFELFDLKYSHYKIDTSLVSAVKARSSGTRCVSLREADIVARSGTDLSVGSLVDTMLMLGDEHYISEGIVGIKTSPWELRVRYNNGLAWLRSNGICYKKANFQDSVPKNVHTALQLMDSIKRGLEIDFGLSFWPSEVFEGFNEIFLTPEYMTIEEYSERRKAIRQCVQL